MSLSKVNSELNLYPSGRRLSYRILRASLRWLLNPTIEGEIHPTDFPLLYVLERRSLLDLIVADIAIEKLGGKSPLDSTPILDESRSFFFLKRGVGRKGRVIAYRFSKRMLRIQERLHQDINDPACDLQPISIYWGRTNEKRGSLVRWLVSDRYAITGRFRRFFGPLLTRSDVLVCFNSGIAWHQNTNPNDSVPQNLRRIARLLRSTFESQRHASLGAPLKSRHSVVASLAKTPRQQGRNASRTHRQRRRIAKRLAANLSYPGMRFLRGVLRVFWHHVYDDIEILNLERITAQAKTHTLIYLPNHRSHIDYLVLSYLLFEHGLAIPFIAAGDNLNLPVVGGILRRCGAFFIRRSFRDDPEYRDILQQYLNQLITDGTSIEFFIEGTRSRTGRMLPGQRGLLHMIMDAGIQTDERPIALVPVYISHEKLIEINSYRKELSGKSKQRESVRDIVRSVRLLPKNMGRLVSKVGQPIDLSKFALEHGNGREAVSLLTDQIVHSINETSVINPTSLLGLALSSFENQSCTHFELVRRIDLLKSLLRVDSLRHDYTVSNLNAKEIVARCESLKLIDFEGDSLVVSKDQAGELDWYRNNVLHSLVVPAVISVLVQVQVEPITQLTLLRNFAGILPYLSGVLQTSYNLRDVKRWTVHLRNALLLENPFENRVFKPEDSEKLGDLMALGRLILPTLESMFVMLSCVEQLEKSRESVGVLVDVTMEITQSIANQVEEDIGLMYDRRFFQSLAQQSLKLGHLIVNEDRQLTTAANLTRLHEQGKQIIRPEFATALKVAIDQVR